MIYDIYNYRYWYLKKKKQLTSYKAPWTNCEVPNGPNPEMGKAKYCSEKKNLDEIDGL